MDLLQALKDQLVLIPKENKSLRNYVANVIKNWDEMVDVSIDIDDYYGPDAEPYLSLYVTFSFGVFRSPTHCQLPFEALPLVAMALPKAALHTAIIEKLHELDANIRRLEECKRQVNELRA